MSKKLKGHLVQVNDPNDDVAIRVEGVSKSFKLPHNKQSSLKGALINLVGRGDRTYEIQEVLKNISFEIKKGEFFGIVGRNGSGKSTLLKMLAGIYTPSSGKIIVNGSLTPFIELGVGFNPELTGRENVYLNGALLGFNEREVDEMYDDIVDFAELERFMDQKLKNYSSGMQVRLAFSIAIRSKSDILLFDEVLAVGDADFQKKCLDTFRELKKTDRTIVLVTHDMGQVERFCDRALVISEGNVVATTSPSEASYIYSKLNINQKLIDKKENRLHDTPDDRPGNGTYRVNKVLLVDGDKKQRLYKTGDKFSLKIILSKPMNIDDKLSVGIAIHNADGVSVVGPNTDNLKIPVGSKEITYSIDRLPLNGGDYTVTIALYDRDSRDEFDVLYQALHFTVANSSGAGGAVNIDNSWTFSDKITSRRA